LQKALPLHRAVGNKQFEANTLNGLGNVYSELGQPQKALEYYDQALKLYKEVQDKGGEAVTLANIGSVYVSTDQPQKGLDYYDQALPILREVQDKPGETITLTNIGIVCYSIGQPQRAMENLEQAHKLAEAVADPDLLFRCQWGLGDAYKAQKRTQEAITAYQKAIDYLESIRTNIADQAQDRLTYLHAGNKVAVYEALIGLLVEQGNVAQALTYLERAKSKQLLDGLRLSSIQVNDPKLNALLSKTESLEQELAAQEKLRLAELSKPEAQQDKAKIENLTQLIAHNRAESLRTYTAVASAYPDYAELLRVKVDDVEDLRRDLPPNVVVLAYMPLENALVTFVVTREGIQARGMPLPRARLEGLVRSFRAEMERAEKARARPVSGQNTLALNLRNWDWNSAQAKPLRETLTALYGYLIAPVKADIDKAETVVIIPSGLLHYLPFAALATETPDKRLRFLAEEKPTLMLPRLGLLSRILAAGPRGRGVGHLAAFGNPDGTLPGAEQEVRAISKLFPQPRMYVGPQATKAQVEHLPSDVQIAHFATHGVLNETDINACYLVLANGGKLTLGEVYGLDHYPARLTVLSACQTALGSKTPGNEAMHLANSFSKAGSLSIVASLWEVSDAATTTLMERFYEELKAGKGVAEALRLAEVSLLKQQETAHPYFWSPFIAIGDWR